MPSNIKPDQILGVRRNLGVDITPGLKPTSAAEQLWSAMALDNVSFNAGMRIGDAAWAQAFPEEVSAEPFDLEARLTEAEKVIMSEFSDVNSDAELRALRERRKRELDHRRALGEGPLPAILASTLAFATDPLSWLPSIAALSRGSAVARIGKVGAVAAGEVALSEAALQALQETRTIEESVAATLLGGAFGMTIGGALVAREAARGLPPVVQVAQAREAVNDAATIMRAQYPESTVGAARVQQIDPEATEPFIRPFTRAMQKTLSKVKLASAASEVINSPFPAARRRLLQLVDVGIALKGDFLGSPRPDTLELNIRAHDGVIGRANRELVEAHRAHRKNGGRMGRKDFFEEIARAGRRGDAHTDPTVVAGAKVWRGVEQEYTRAAQKLGLLPEDIPLAEALSYVSRIYRKDKLRGAGREKFKGITVNWLREQAPNEDVVILQEIAEDIVRAIEGAPGGRTQSLGAIGTFAPGARGPLKERTFHIPDALIEEFLENDVQIVMNRFIRTMAADIETMKMFGEVDPIATIAREIRDDTTRLAEAEKNTRKKAKIQKEGQIVEETMADMINGIRGVRGDVFRNPKWAGVGNLLGTTRNLNFATMLGGVTVSSVPDVGLPVMREGLLRTIGPVIGEFARGFKGIRMARREAQLYGAAWEIANNGRTRRLFDIGDRYEAQTILERAERGSEKIAHAASQLFLANQWTEMMKSTSGMVIGTRILRTARKVGRNEQLTKGEARRLARSGLSMDEARLIADEAETWDIYGAGPTEVIIGNSQQWQNRELAHKFGRVLLRDIDATILTPGVGDAPTWTSTEAGKSIFQFKRFASAATDRVLIAGIQGLAARDMAALNGIMALVGMGAFVTAMKDIVAKGEVQERSWAEWVAKSVDQGGLGGLFMELHEISDMGLHGDPRLASQLLGPTAGTVQKAGGLAGAVLSGRVDQGDIRKARRLLPLQNTFYLRWMFDQVEEGVNRAFNVPRRQPRRRPVAPPRIGG